MTRAIDRLADVAGGYDAIVFDQWGVMHNGTVPYPGAVACIDGLAAGGVKLAVLSNSGKRALPNADRIAGMGFDTGHFKEVMTSGEALWRDIALGRIAARRFWPIERAEGDAAAFASGLDVVLVPEPQDAEAVLLMGVPDGSSLDDWRGTLDAMAALSLPIYCSNPDRHSPRAEGLVISPGALAHAYQEAGHEVIFYGKPHLPIFAALQSALGVDRILMVGDSLEHDIAGAQGAGWDSLLIQGGIDALGFAAGDADTALAALAADRGVAPPTYRMDTLA